MSTEKCPVLGIDIGGTSIKLGVVTHSGEIVWRRQIPFEKGDPMAVLNRIARAAKPALAEYPDLGAIGISVAGKVDTKYGTTHADNLQWHGVPARDVLAGLLGLPAAIDNDAQCAMLAEWQSGACRGAENVAYLTFGTGVGGGMIINGRPYRGRQNSAAEFGHIITHANGRHCNCGHRGCYEVYASTTALKKMMGGRYSVKEIVQGAKDGDQDFVRTFNYYIEEVALGLVTIMAMLSPDYLVLGGGLSNAGAFFLDKVKARMRKFEAWIVKPTKIVLAKYGNDAGVIGAAAIARQKAGRT